MNVTAPAFEGTLNLLNRSVVDKNGVSWFIHAFAAPTYPNAYWLFNKLNNNQPVMVWFRDQYQNHAIVLKGGRYKADSVQRFFEWESITAYDPYLDKDVIIDAYNIPAFVYGTFDTFIQRY